MSVDLRWVWLTDEAPFATKLFDDILEKGFSQIQGKLGFGQLGPRAQGPLLKYVQLGPDLTLRSPIVHLQTNLVGPCGPTVRGPIYQEPSPSEGLA